MAKEQGLAITTKDSDFVDRLLLDDSPPKVVWVRLGNCPIASVERCLRENERLERALEESDEYRLLVLPSGLLV
jgi:predicted nuclease of predicted toxin-antitoxin system